MEESLRWCWMNDPHLSVDVVCFYVSDRQLNSFVSYVFIHVNSQLGYVIKVSVVGLVKKKKNKKNDHTA